MSQKNSLIRCLLIFHANQAEIWVCDTDPTIVRIISFFKFQDAQRACMGPNRNLKLRAAKLFDNLDHEQTSATIPPQRFAWSESHFHC